MNKTEQFAGLAGLVVLIFALIMQFLIADDQLYLGPLHLIIGLALLAVFVIRGGVQALGSAASRRAAGFGAGVTLYSALFVGVLVLANFLVSRHEFLHYDSTEQKVYTLAPQTIDTLEKIDRPVVIRGFFLGGQMDPKSEDLLLRIAHQSPNVSWRLVDPEKNPTLIEKFGISESGTLHLSFDKGESTRTVKITRDITEQEVVNGLLKLVRGAGKKVYYVAGHGEPDLSAQTEIGYLFLKEAIQGENLALEEVLLSDTRKVPEDAAAIILAAPQRALLPLEHEAINDYLSAGGAAIFLHEPRTTDEIAKLVKPLGVEVGSDVVVDQVVHLFAGPGLGVEPVVSSYGSHEITEQFTQNTVFSTASSVKTASELAEGTTVTELAFSGEQSWAERNIEDLFGEEPTAELEESDLQGPISLAVAHENSSSRVVVFGDADFVSNLNIRQLFNRDLFLNALNWVIGQDGGVTIRARTLRESTQAITPDQFSIMFLVTAILVPELLLLCGLSAWWRRRS